MSNLGLIDKYVGPRGWVLIELVDKDGRVKYTNKKNVVTDLGKLLYLYSGANMRYIDPAGNNHGKLFCSSNLGKSALNTVYSNIFNAHDNGECLYLANIADTIPAGSTLLPLYDENFAVDTNLITGYASYKTTSPNAKEGVQAEIKGTHWASDMAVVKRYVFDNTKGNGTFNKLLIGSHILANRFNGICISKGISKNLDIGDNYGYYLGPGVTGITNSNEILFAEHTNYDREDAAARYIFNLDTGAFTTLEATDARYSINLSMARCPMVISGGYAYYIVGASAYANIVKISLADGSISVSGSITSLTNAYSLFLYNGLLYVRSSSTTFAAWNPATLTAVTASNILVSTLSANYPTEFTAANVQIGSYGSNYVVVDTVSGYGVICSDITNVNATIVKLLFNVYSVNMFDVGSDMWCLMNDVKDDFGARRVNNATTVTASNAMKACKVNGGMDGNMQHYIELSTPITKTSDDTMYVTFGIEYLTA